MYQPPCEIISTNEIIDKIDHNGEISIRHRNNYKPYFEVATDNDKFIYEIKDIKNIDFKSVDEWINDCINNSKEYTIYIWSGCEFTILTTDVYNYKGDSGYVIRKEHDNKDIGKDEKVYSESEIRDYIEKITDEYIFVDNHIENSIHSRHEKFTSSKDLWDKRKPYIAC